MTVKGRMESGLLILVITYFILLPILIPLTIFGYISLDKFLIAIGVVSWAEFAFGFLIGD
jgi:hypothetical protein